MERLKQIRPLEHHAIEQAGAQWNSIAKPLDGLGTLEKMISRIAGITGDPDVRLPKRAVVIFCADHGVVCEGISQSDSSVTAIVARALAEGTSNISRMAETLHAEVIPVDIGMKEPVSAPGLLDRRVAAGTANLAEGAAMTLSQTVQAVSAGMDMAGDCKRAGISILIAGEMGIGNTTAASALAAVLLGLPPKQVTGRGAGLDDAGLFRKTEVIRRALAVNHPDAEKPLELLAKLGGLEIAGMTGLFLGGAVYRIPVIMDGMISVTAAVLAAKIHPLAREYMLCSHCSAEPAAEGLLRLLGMNPPITAGLHLGEGTGGILLLPLLDAALSVYHNDAHRFSALSMQPYQKFPEEEDGKHRFFSP